MTIQMLVPVTFIVKSGWDAYQVSGKQLTREVKGHVIGALVLFLLTMMFVIDVDTNPLWYAVLSLGGLLGMYRLVRRTA